MNAKEKIHTVALFVSLIKRNTAVTYDVNVRETCFLNNFILLLLTFMKGKYLIFNSDEEPE